MNVSDFTMRCGNGPQCRHPICEHCGDPLRHHTSRAADHPGTRQRARGQQCYRCYKTRRHAGTLTPEDLQDQRHILMSETEMRVIRERDPNHWEWLMQRRHRLNLSQGAAA